MLFKIRFIGLLIASVTVGACSGGGGGDAPTGSASGVAPAGGSGNSTGITASGNIITNSAAPAPSDSTVVGAAPPTNVNTVPPQGNTVAGTSPDPSATPGDTPAVPSDRTWRTPTVLARTPGQTTASDVQTDSAGNALAVWRGDGPEDLYASRYDAATQAWSTPELLETLPAPVLAFDLQVAPNGRAIVAWFQGDGETRATYVRRFVPASGWGALEPIDDATFGRPAAAIDNAGNAYVVYDHNEASSLASTFFGRAASADGAFGPAETVAGPQTRLAIADLAIAATTRTALFVHDTTPIGSAPGQWQVYATRYNDTAWTALERFDNETQEVAAARLVTNAAGDARGYWVTDGAIKHRFAAASDSTWSPVATIAFTPSGYRRGAGMNIGGEAILATSGPNGVFAARYSASAGWSAYLPVLERRGFVGTLQAPRLDAEGNAAISWLHGDPDTDSVDYSTYHLWANVLN